MPNVGGPELLIILVWLLPLVVGVLALVDLAQRPEAQLEAAGQSKTVWLIVAILSLFVPCVFLGAAYYLLAVRPKLPPRHPV